MKSIDALDAAFNKSSKYINYSFRKALGKLDNLINYYIEDGDLSYMQMNECELFGKEILKLMKSASGDEIHALITKALPNGLCGSKVTKNQSIMMFYDYVMVIVVKQQLLVMNLYYSMKDIGAGLRYFKI